LSSPSYCSAITAKTRKTPRGDEQELLLVLALLLDRRRRPRACSRREVERGAQAPLGVGDDLALRAVAAARVAPGAGRRGAAARARSRPAPCPRPRAPRSDGERHAAAPDERQRLEVGRVDDARRSMRTRRSYSSSSSTKVPASSPSSAARTVCPTSLARDAERGGAGAVHLHAVLRPAALRLRLHARQPGTPLEHALGALAELEQRGRSSPAR
jgi:hypothetical protein